MSKAAKRMNCTPPGMSQQIAALERNLGLRLFERSSRGVEPTAAGERFYAKCLEILRVVSSAQEEVVQMRGQVMGVVSAGFIPSLSKAVLPAVLNEYTSAHPSVDVRITEAYSGILTDLVMAGELEFAVVTLPPDDAGLEVEKLDEQPMALISGKGLGLEPLRRIRLDEVPGLKLVMPSPQHSLRPAFARAMKTGEISAEQCLSIDGMTGTLEFVEQSDWAAILPASVCLTEVARNRFTVNPIEAPNLMFEFMLIQPARATLSEPARLLIDCVRRHLGEVREGWERTIKGVSKS